MFAPRHLHFYDYVERPYDPIRTLFAGGIVDALQGATTEAAHRALELSDTLEARLGAVELGAPIDVRVLSFEQSAIGEPFEFCRLRFEWTAAEASALFPVMHAELAVHPVGERESQLAFFGTYRPPLGLLGRGADALLGQRIAEASVHRFVRDLKHRLEVRIPPSEVGP